MLDKYNLVAGECVFIDDREDNIVDAKDVGMTGIVFDDIEKAIRKLSILLGESGL